MAAAAAAAEASCREALAPDVIEQRLRQLEQDLSALLEDIRPSKPSNREILQVTLQNLLEKLRQSDTSATEQLSTLRDQMAKGNLQPLPEWQLALQRAEQAMDRYDFESAAAALELLSFLSI